VVFLSTPTPPTQIYTLSLHDALPIFFTTGFTTGQASAEGLPPTGRIAAPGVVLGPSWEGFYVGAGIGAGTLSYDVSGEAEKSRRSEEHTSELQSRENLVCRLLLEKKK